MRNRSGFVNLLFALSLFCVFAVSALLVVIMGADVYRDIAANMEANYNARVSVSYITEKVRQNDASGGVEVRAFGEGTALVLLQSAGEYAYETWIYEQDGYLEEATAEAGNELFGERITKLKSLSFEQAGSLITVSVTDEYENTHQAAVHLRSAGGGL